MNYNEIATKHLEEFYPRWHALSAIDRENMVFAFIQGFLKGEAHQLEKQARRLDDIHKELIR